MIPTRASGEPEITMQSATDGDEVSRRGLEIYESRLKATLEPAYEGQVVAIHIGSGAYQVAASAGAAMRAMRGEHPTGALLLHTIGISTDAGLAARMSGERIFGLNK